MNILFSCCYDCAVSSLGCCVSFPARCVPFLACHTVSVNGKLLFLPAFFRFPFLTSTVCCSLMVCTFLPPLDCYLLLCWVPFLLCADFPTGVRYFLCAVCWFLLTTWIASWLSSFLFFYGRVLFLVPAARWYPTAVRHFISARLLYAVSCFLWAVFCVYFCVLFPASVWKFPSEVSRFLRMSFPPIFTTFSQLLAVFCPLGGTVFSSFCVLFPFACAVSYRELSPNFCLVFMLTFCCCFSTGFCCLHL